MSQMDILLIFLKNYSSFLNQKNTFRDKNWIIIIFYKSDTGSLTQLETKESSKPLMEYFNSFTNKVERQELICSARMIHCGTNSLEHRRIQVDSSINFYKEKMKRYSKRYSLNGFPAKVCFMIRDILHHGRGTRDDVSFCIDTNRNFEKTCCNLLGVGEHLYRVCSETPRINNSLYLG